MCHFLIIFQLLNSYFTIQTNYTYDIIKSNYRNDFNDFIVWRSFPHSMRFVLKLFIAIVINDSSILQYIWWLKWCNPYFLYIWVPPIQFSLKAAVWNISYLPFSSAYLPSSNFSSKAAVYHILSVISFYTIMIKQNDNNL